MRYSDSLLKKNEKKLGLLGLDSWVHIHQVNKMGQDMLGRENIMCTEALESIMYLNLQWYGPEGVRGVAGNSDRC